jgi:amphi-Trp domain-containing protein
MAKRKTARRKSTKTRPSRDVEKDYPAKQFVAKLRRLADAIEKGRRFQIQIAGERISIPSDAVINLEHERSGGEEEVEFQLKWRLADD